MAHLHASLLTLFQLRWPPGCSLNMSGTLPPQAFVVSLSSAWNVFRTDTIHIFVTFPLSSLGPNFSTSVTSMFTLFKITTALPTPALHFSFFSIFFSIIFFLYYFLLYYDSFSRLLLIFVSSHWNISIMNERHLTLIYSKNLDYPLENCRYPINID